MAFCGNSELSAKLFNHFYSISICEFVGKLFENEESNFFFEKYGMPGVLRPRGGEFGP